MTSFFATKQVQTQGPANSRAAPTATPLAIAPVAPLTADLPINKRTKRLMKTWQTQFEALTLVPEMWIDFHST